MKPEETLDNQEPQKTKIIFKSFIPLAIASIICLISCIEVWIKPDHNLIDPMLYALIFLGVIWAAVPLKKDTWKYLFLVFLGLYFLNYVNISDTHRTIFFGPIQISYIPTAFIVAFLLLNKNFRSKLVNVKAKTEINKEG